MLWRVISFDLTKVIFASCFTLRGHDTHIDFLWVLFLVGTYPSDANLMLFVSTK